MGAVAPSPYKATASRIKESTLADFLADKLSDDVRTIPGVGPENAKCLAEAGIYTPLALAGQFLLLKKPGMTINEHVQAFNTWLAGLGVSSHRADIVRSIAEKVNTWQPGLYNESLFV